MDVSKKSPRLESSISDSSSINNNKNEMRKGENKEDVDIDIVAQALRELSVEERTKVYSELHGVADIIEETPELVSQQLNEMEIELTKLKHDDSLPTAAITLAESLSPQYVADPDFRMRFLRSSEFDPSSAAECMIRFFEHKFMLFGGSKLCKDITYDDLEPEDIVVMKKGFMQTLPVRDRSGRLVVIFFPCEQEYSDVQSFGRVLFYMTMFPLVDHAIEQKGAVLIGYNAGAINYQRLYPQTLFMLQKAMSSMPYKIISVHFCFNNPLFKFVASTALTMMGKKIFPRAKFHRGTFTEIRYSLMTYGIPASFLPVADDGSVKLTNHLETIEVRRTQEAFAENGKEFDLVVFPDNLDVLFGKGRPIQEHIGNVRLKSMVDDLLPHYETLTKQEKIDYAREVVEKIKVSGSRFLSQESGVWMKVQDDVARSKVAHLFRNRRKAAIAKQKKMMMMTTMMEDADTAAAATGVGSEARDHSSSTSTTAARRTGTAYEGKKRSRQTE